LDLRVKRSDESAQKITGWLENHPKVEKLLHPFSKSFPQYELAQEQMKGAGGLFSVLFKTTEMKNVENFFHRLNRFLFAVSWGGHESLIMPFCAFHNIPGRKNSPYPWNLVRFYIGLEDPEWLMEDLEKAIEVL
jgi:cystathionine beta-lyase/cystathionine gamma-synthase